MDVYTAPEIIAKISALIRVPIPLAEEDLESHIVELNALQYDLAEATSDTLRLLYEKRKQLLWPKEKEVTELDRKIRVDADTAPIQRNYELLTRIEALVDTRLRICLQLLS